MIKCLILEDEPAAQKVLGNYISKTPFIECLGVYETGLQIPQELIKEIDLLFLDIQLPEINGLSFLKTLPQPPKVIITTAFTDYALQAFEEAVIDYLLKPFSYERFFKAISRVQQSQSKVQIPSKETIFLYADKTLYNVQVADILYLKSEVDYVNVVTTERNYLILDSLRHWVEKLTEAHFCQVHRSYVVNIQKISKVRGNQIFFNDEIIPIGKKHKEAFLNMLN